MKIAIMTQPLGHNYGGIMQAWALQKVLKGMGHEPVTIDRQPDPKGYTYCIARLGYRLLKKTVGKYQEPINIERYLPTILQNTRAFIDQNITMSEPLSSTVSLKAHFAQQQYDAVIVGSDQAWRPRYSPNIGNFFLDFLEDIDIKRIAYASSFGVDEWEFTQKQTQQYSALAKGFNDISVREDTGVELCRKHLGVEATQVPDPTLLLGKTDYLKLIGLERLSNTPHGIYTYFLDQTPEKQGLAQHASVQLGEPEYSCQVKCRLRAGVRGSTKNITMPDIRDWLAGFANARFILTDSFHGMVFSILFNKPFFVIRNSKRGQARIESLARAFECEDLLVERARSVNLVNFNEDGFRSLSSLLNGVSEPGARFLEKSLGNESI